MNTSDQPVALVTGGASGIGGEVARTLARSGHVVVLVDRDADLLRTSVADMTATGAVVMGILCDVTVREDVVRAIRDVDTTVGRLDVVVNCAGTNEFRVASDVSGELWDHLIQVNLTGTWNVCAASLALLKRSSAGRIVNIGSAAAVLGIPQAVPYTAAKHGIVGLTKALAIDLGPDGVTVNCVCPGPVSTPLTAVATSPSFLQQAVDRIPLGRVGTPRDIAAAVAFLASGDASWITGVVLPVDGGLVCSVRAHHWE